MEKSSNKSRTPRTPRSKVQAQANEIRADVERAQAQADAQAQAQAQADAQAQAQADAQAQAQADAQAQAQAAIDAILAQSASSFAVPDTTPVSSRPRGKALAEWQIAQRADFTSRLRLYGPRVLSLQSASPTLVSSVRKENGHTIVVALTSTLAIEGRWSGDTVTSVSLITSLEVCKALGLPDSHFPVRVVAGSAGKFRFVRMPQNVIYFSVRNSWLDLFDWLSQPAQLEAFGISQSQLVAISAEVGSIRQDARRALR